MEFGLGLLLSGLGGCGLSLAGLLALAEGRIGIFGAASLMLLAAGLMLLAHARGQAASLIFDNPHQSLIFVQRSGLKVPVPYSRIKGFEIILMRGSESSHWTLVVQFRDGTSLPLQTGSQKRLQKQQQDLSEWVFLDLERPGAELNLPPLPSWLHWRQSDAGLRAEWKSRLGWSQILLSTGFILAFALICYLAAQPTEGISFWIFRGFSGLLAGLALVLLGHGIRTRKRRWWLEWQPDELKWGYQSFLSRRRRQLASLTQTGELHFYWTFEVPRLVVLAAEAEAELQRKRRLNPSYSMQSVLHMLNQKQRFDLELPGFRAAEILLLKEKLTQWQAQRRPATQPEQPDQTVPST
ncbi:MAG: hypothetical protein CVV27_10150 [Candidatus Melainabacteria bacterium HGW-Melainabacteria-1]|nr:MAG: hypothetical protein CVV27_10150 [Candidatus Melainabacteria bacterium HGW-Melainabacteria-1]